MGVGVGVVVQPIVLVVALGRDQPVEERPQVVNSPGSYSMVVTATVEPRTKALACPSVTPDRATSKHRAR